MATKLDQAALDKLRGPINKVWNYIGSDSEQCAAECGERLTNAGAMEGCLDAGRMAAQPINETAAHDFLIQLFDEHGYAKVQKFLCKHIRLV